MDEGTLEDHVAQREQEAAGEIPSTSDSTAAAASIAIGGFNQIWYERGSEVTRTRQTSLVIDPPDGRMPALTPEGEQRRRDLLAAMEIPDGPEDRSLPERCIIGSKQGPPMLPGGYNRNIQIFQTPDHVIIHQEMIHEARIIPLDGRPHLPFRSGAAMRAGYWEGDTLGGRDAELHQCGCDRVHAADRQPRREPARGRALHARRRCCNPL